MLLLSAAIGVYYGFFAKKESDDDTEEFLMAGKSMGTFPIAMSLIARLLQVKLCDQFQFSHRKRAQPCGHSIGTN